MGTATLTHPLRLRSQGPIPGAPRKVTRTLAIPKPPPSNAWTHGWDSVFAIRFPDANRRLAKPGVCPDKFDIQNTVYKATGTFGPWQLASGDDGGDGSVVILTIPVTGGSLDYRGQTFALNPSRFLVSVQLSFLTNRTVHIPTGIRTELVFKADAAPGVLPVTVLDYDHSDPIVQALLRADMQKWLNTQLPSIQHVFAAVDINVTLENDSFQWLAPTYTSYAVHSGKDEASSFLAVLGLCQGRDPAGLNEQLSGSAIPPGDRAAFLVSPELFFRNLLAPSVASAFSATAADFPVASSEAGPVMTNGKELPLKSFQHEGTTYHPVLQNLSLTVNAGEIVMQTVTRIPISPGIRAYAKQTSHHVLQLVNKPGGGKTLQLVDSQPATSDHWSEIDPGVQIIEGLITVVGVVAGLALSLVTDGLSLVLAGLMVGLLTGLAAATPDLIASVLGGELADSAPSIDGLIFNATNFIRWPGAQEFALTSATFASSLQLGGDPNFGS